MDKIELVGSQLKKLNLHSVLVVQWFKSFPPAGVPFLTHKMGFVIGLKEKHRSSVCTINVQCECSLTFLSLHLTPVQSIAVAYCICATYTSLTFRAQRSQAPGWLTGREEDRMMPEVWFVLWVPQLPHFLPQVPLSWNSRKVSPCRIQHTPGYFWRERPSECFRMSAGTERPGLNPGSFTIVKLWAKVSPITTTVKFG